jgi:hypothetical protein
MRAISIVQPWILGFNAIQGAIEGVGLHPNFRN